MNRVLRTIFMRDRMLVTKLFVFSAVLVVVPLCVIGLISYERSAGVLENEARQYSWQIIDQVNTHVEYYVNDFEIDIIKLVNTSNINGYIKSKTEMERSSVREAVRQELRRVAYSRSDISNITIVLDNLETVDAIDPHMKHPLNRLTEEPWYDTIPSTSELKIFTRTLQWDNHNEQVISIARRLFSPLTLEPIGMIVMDVNFKRFQEIAQKVSIGSGGYMYIVDSEGNYVYHPNLSELGKPADFERLGDILQGGSGSIATTSGQKRLLTYSSSSFLGWTLITSIPYEELLQGTEYIRSSILVTVLIALAVAAILGFGFAGSIIRPIKKLHSDMRKVEAGNFSASIPVESKDEIGLLTHGFNRMVSRLQSLLDEVYFSKLRETESALRQREVELKALQSQINPHFMYNALETIRGMALEHSLDEISAIASSMGRLLRYNLKKEANRVSLEEELHFAEIYLRIQKFRFEEKLEYEISIPEWAKTQSIAKFSLQPIVENCIVHGVEPAQGTIRIDITAIRDSEHSFVVRIRDAGIGISEAKLADIARDLKERDVIAGGANIGIVNVHRRIGYLFGEQYGVSIESRLEQGTTVAIRLPLQSPAQDKEAGHDHAFDFVG